MASMTGSLIFGLMDPELRTYLDQKFDAIGAHFELVETRLNARLDAVERRLDVMEQRLDSMESRFEDRFTSIEEKLASLALRIDQFEARVTAEFAEIRQDIAHLTLRIDNLTARVDRLEAGFRHLNERIDGLGEDMRQRFRIVNDRLSALAA